MHLQDCDGAKGSRGFHVQRSREVLCYFVGKRCRNLQKIGKHGEDAIGTFVGGSWGMSM